MEETRHVSTELISAILIGTPDFTGLPVSTTHIVNSGAGYRRHHGGLRCRRRYGMISRIVIAGLVTPPVTILIA